ncbi:hydroxymethylglutaryl-CoA lyase [Taibaiella soli]|uniref:Hydroxymethylglutaryl-CoA lyase n=1 Tax=Taibaiella soli TaxID=1649169 RepID=A0A2W2ADV5_9BACT|nr:hydroxymethylglutaryl-CoA lyase [Taibaiella soli]PZF71732.1 hydroxymethylglutaryl-CoA lyase [Taibaiella soli]
MSAKITLVECPRDAMQGWEHFIPTAKKIEYINKLLRVGFDVLDFGSFVSAKAIPQLADTKEVIPHLNLDGTNTKLLAIIANTRGAEDAVVYDQISYLGFPFSISETFQMRNTNKTIAQSLTQVEEMQNLCVKHGKEMVIYISMGFGNPYGDPYNAEVAIDWVGKLSQLGIKTFAMSDTVGVAKPDTIEYIFSHLVPEFKDLNIGAHFHSTADKWEEKMDAAYKNGCLRFDSSMKGIGGCPMAEDELVGNIATENLVYWAEKNKIELGINLDAFYEASQMAAGVFI